MKKIYLIVLFILVFLNSGYSQDLPLSLSGLNTSPNKISEIEAVSKDKSIEITFKNSRTDRELVIYRSTLPITTYNNLLSASLIATISSNSENYIDFPRQGIPYFYIIMDSLLTKSGNYVIEPGKNVTENSVLIRKSLSSERVLSRETLRNQPLPFLDLKSSINSGKLLVDSSSELPVKYNLTFESDSIVKNIVKSIFLEENDDLIPVILNEDLVTSETSEDYQLKRILESDFKEQNWSIAYELLTNFLSVDHSGVIKIKAHFYRAQVLFFQHKYRESFMEFIIVHEDMPVYTKTWIDTLLINMAKRSS
jgi:hypothetical protein